MKKLFIPAYLKKDPLPAVEKSLKLLAGFERIGLVTTSQHISQLSAVADFLQRKGKKPFIGGQILGCNRNNAKNIEKDVDCFLYIGSGKFHITRLAVGTEKPVFVANPYSDSAEKITEEEKKKYSKKRQGRILKAAEGSVFGIIVSTKTGQYKMKTALELKKKLTSLGKKAFIFAGSEINPGNLLPFKVDAWINTACPRIAEDEFSKPVINPDELELLEKLLTKS
jgi:2-(3-amino-3-carboxypropyl)histidine synthase